MDTMAENDVLALVPVRTGTAESSVPVLSVSYEGHASYDKEQQRVAMAASDAFIIAPEPGGRKGVETQLPSREMGVEMLINFETGRVVGAEMKKEDMSMYPGLRVNKIDPNLTREILDSPEMDVASKKLNMEPLDVLEKILSSSISAQEDAGRGENKNISQNLEKNIEKKQGKNFLSGIKDSGLYKKLNGLFEKVQDIELFDYVKVNLEGIQSVNLYEKKGISVEIDEPLDNEKRTFRLGGNIRY